MWLMTVYGFYSASVYTPNRVTVRARMRVHLENLKARFQTLKAVPIVKTPERDYPFRMVVDQKEWVSMVSALVAEQTWANFKDAAAKFEKEHGQPRAYVDMLHTLWHVIQQKLERKTRLQHGYIDAHNEGAE